MASTNFDKRTYPAVDAADKVSCRPISFVFGLSGLILDGENLSWLRSLKDSAATPPTTVACSDRDRYNVYQ